MRSVLQIDGNAHSVQVFAPIKFVAVTEDEAWTPSETDLAFAVTADISYLMTGFTTEVPLTAGTIRGIIQGYTYTFSATSVLEVM